MKKLQWCFFCTAMLHHEGDVPLNLSLVRPEHIVPLYQNTFWGDRNMFIVCLFHVYLDFLPNCPVIQYNAYKRFLLHMGSDQDLPGLTRCLNAVKSLLPLSSLFWKNVLSLATSLVLQVLYLLMMAFTLFHGASNVLCIFFCSSPDPSSTCFESLLRNMASAGRWIKEEVYKVLQ